MELNINWTVEKRKTSDLKFWEDNPRSISPAALQQLRAKIISKGLHAVLTIDTDNTVLSGNQRLTIARELGLEEVWVMLPERALTEQERIEVALESNINEGEWIFSKLSNFDQELLRSIGFNPVQIDRIYDLKTSEDDFDADAEAAKITVPKSQRGEVYKLGNHRLMCGDSTSEADLKTLMGEELADLVFTDPPYMVDYKSPSGMSYNSTRFGGSGGKIFNDNLNEQDALQFYIDVLKNLNKFSKDYTPIYWWFANKNNLINRLAFDETGWFMSQVIIWLKNSMVFSRGQDFHRCYEPCMFGWKKGKKHYTAREIANYKDTFGAMDIDEFQHYIDVWYQRRDNTAEYVHPTQKPVKLAERALKKNSKQDSIVLDLFGGSGSTLIACQQMDRKAYLMELDPKYVDVIIKRWEKFTGSAAVKL